MEPVRIKYYGLIPMTKQGYLITLLAVGLPAVLILVVCTVIGVLPPLETIWRPLPRANWFVNHFWHIMLLLFVAQAIDTVVTLRVFARKEAEQRRERELAEARVPRE
jgi:hypothetical protein